MHRNQNLVVPIVAMAMVVVASNILVQFLLGDWLTWGAFTYPVAFLVNDVTNRLYGRKAAQKVILWGFAVGIVCSLALSQIDGEFGPWVTLRIALGSGMAFLVAQLVDVSIFSSYEESSRRFRWWRAPVVSSVCGSTLDTALFFSIAFSAEGTVLLGADHNTEFFNEVVLTPFGFEMTRWVGTAIIDWMVKMGIVLVALYPFWKITRSHKTPEAYSQL